jgi:formylglycine-generating enzyme required for sulfatase activity
MAGQVWEWTLDKWGASGVRRVVLGGSFDQHRRNASCTSRYRDFADYDWDYNGFRVVVSSIFFSCDEEIIEDE